jgi:hypothetical protein
MQIANDDCNENLNEATLHCEDGIYAGFKGKCGENVFWAFDDSTGMLTIFGTGAMYDYSHNNRPWEGYNIKTVVIQYGVTTIGDNAFYNCTSLTSITIPDGVATIGDSAFYFCNSLASVTIPDSVTKIGVGAFDWCRGLTNIRIPGSITKVGGFDSCGFENVTIGDGATEICGYAFFCCSYLTSIRIPVSITEIGDYAFDGCSELEEVYYGGTEGDWQKISIGLENDPLLNATIHFKTCEHIFSEWNIETPQTCTENGLKNRECSECGKTEEIEISATGHNYELIVTPPICTDRGYTTHTCANCNDTYVDNYVDATGHKYNEVVTQSTCEQNGYTTCICECGDSYISNIIAPTGHADNEKNGYCDICDELLCDHDCHRGGFAGFFWKITNFFNKLFRTKQYCECGVAHY